MMNLKKLCLFSSFSEKKTIDNNVKYYLIQLKNYFDEVIFITNTRELNDDSHTFLILHNITLKQVPNNGLDFGMYVHVIKDLNMNLYENLALVNDSCYLFKPLNNFFDWYQNNKLDVVGFTDCLIKEHHIQSYFVVYSKNTLQPVKDYFIKNGIIDDRKEIIETYEIGLSKYLRNLSFNIVAMYPTIKGTSNVDIKNINRMLQDIENILLEGIPLIKRKVLHNSFSEIDSKSLKDSNYNYSIDYRKLIDVDDRLLNYLIPNNLVVYQIYYNKSQKIYLSEDTIPYYNDKLSVYFENDIIKDLYKVKNKGDYFGVLSWKFIDKNKFDFKSEYIDGKYDIYIFNPLIEDVFYESNVHHPFFISIFKYVLEKLNIDTDINLSIGLYTNSIIARSNIYKKYVDEYLIPTMKILDNIDETDRRSRIINKKLWSDSKYLITDRMSKRLKEYTGKPYYTYHSFICERLWSVFYELHKNEFTSKIITYPKHIS
jgi:hypothetical protein